MKQLILAIVILQFISALHAQMTVDGLDASSEHYNPKITVVATTDRFGVATLIVEVPKSEVSGRSGLSVVLRASNPNKKSYTYIPLLIEDGDNVESWSARTGQNVTRTWMRKRHGIFFATCKFPKSKLKEFSLEILLGGHMKNPTYQYALDKLKEDSSLNRNSD